MSRDVLDEEVEIAVRPRLSAREGTEDADVTDTIALSERADRGRAFLRQHEPSVVAYLATPSSSDLTRLFLESQSCRRSSRPRPRRLSPAGACNGVYECAYTRGEARVLMGCGEGP